MGRSSGGWVQVWERHPAEQSSLAPGGGEQHLMEPELLQAAGGPSALGRHGPVWGWRSTSEGSSVEGWGEGAKLVPFCLFQEGRNETAAACLRGLRDQPFADSLREGKKSFIAPKGIAP